MTGCKRQYAFIKNPKTDLYKCYGKYNHITKKCEKHYNSPKKGAGGDWQVPWPRVGGGGNANQEINEDKMFERMCAWDEYNYIVGASAKDCEELRHAEASGIIDDHAYSVIDCFPNVADTGIDLIKVRNPWGSGEIQNGDFDDEGPGWKLFPEIKQLLKPVVADDGIFYVTKEEFFELFGNIYLSCSDMTAYKED